MEKRVIRDPIHGYIHISEQLIWDLMNTREFQRLRRIRQLGSTPVVFPSGTHTRMLHSLGVYEVARRMLAFSWLLHRHRENAAFWYVFHLEKRQVWIPTV